MDTLPEQSSGHGEGGNVTVSQSCGKWYISIHTKSDVSTPVHPSASIVGLDAGMAKPATLSDGTVFELVNIFRKTRRSCRDFSTSQLSRKVKFSNSRQKQKRKIQRLHSRIVNIRRTTFTKSQRPSAKSTR
ncbi:TPA: transposase [Escherichia albertii]|nr:transposase [Escherichia albertii]